ncbi:MAG: hypothetical protein RIT43_2165 [Bacteroidota bacterium]|jgi:type IX secretion system PorP/SprF family membrane protein
MKKLFLVLLAICHLSFLVEAQQDEQSGMYMFNPLQFNPAYAGSKEYMQLVGVARMQWIGIKGAPQSQFLSFHSPMTFKNMAAGIHLSNDRIGARNRTSAFADYAYTVRFKNGHKLNFGVSFGGDQLSVDYSKLYALDPTDPQYVSSLNQFKFNAGAGLYYRSDNFYVGMSVPRLIQSKLDNDGILISGSYTKRHYYTMAGYIFNLNSDIDLKTSMLLKMVVGAPVTVDVNANLFLYKKVWIGGMYRYNESVGVNAAYQIKESFMFGYGFDYPINALSSVRNFGSHELMLSYLFGKNRKDSAPKYF